MANYLDPIEYNDAMVECVKLGKLTKKFLDMFEIHARNVCRRFYIPDAQDKNDAVASCYHDLCLYWKNFSIYNCLQLKFNTEIIPKDKFHIDIANYGIITLEAGEENDFDHNIFGISTTTNRTIKNMVKLLQQEKYQNVLKVSSHSVNFKFSMTDLWNKDNLEIYSHFRIEPVQIKGRPMMIREDKLIKKLSNTEWEFGEPPKAFLFCTSLCNNSIIKSLSKTSPAPLRNGKGIRLSINQEANGIFTL